VAVLRDVLERGVALHVVDVPSGTSLVAAVEGGLARAGRAFGAVLAVELMKGGRYRGEEHDGLLDELAFRSWTRVERRFARRWSCSSTVPTCTSRLADLRQARRRAGGAWRRPPGWRA
jgi:hypothetical protein